MKRNRVTVRTYQEKKPRRERRKAEHDRKKKKYEEKYIKNTLAQILVDNPAT